MAACGTVELARKLYGRVGLSPRKLRYTPEMAGGSLLPARFLAWNTCYTSHIRKCDLWSCSPRTEFSMLMRYLEALRV